MRVVVFCGNVLVGDEDARLAAVVGREIAARGWLTVTGGGPGLMDVVCRAAKMAGGETYAVQLNVPGRLHSVHVDRAESYTDLRLRQSRLIELGDAFIVLPGGVGTLSELFEVMARQGKGQIPMRPLVLVGPRLRPVWELLNGLAKQGYLALSDVFWDWVADPDSAVDVIGKAPPNHCK